MKKTVADRVSKSFFFLLLFFTSCSSHLEKRDSSKKTAYFCFDVQAEDKQWMEKFFRDFFLEGSAIYTLFGTKPMSQVAIVTATEEKWIEWSMPYLKTEKEKKKKEVLSKIKLHSLNYDLSQNWEKWMTWRKKCSQSPFLFAQRSIPENEHLFNAYVINVPEVAWTLQKHYSLFSRELKMGFDPLEATLEFKDPHSIFWEKVFSNHLLLGILYGYGERNAYFFSRQFSEKEKVFNDCFFISTSSDNDRKEGGTLKELQLPYFRSYELPYNEDPVIAKYKEERKSIQNQLKRKDFLEEVLYQIFKCNKSLL